MDTSKSFQDLIVWQKSHEFVLKVYHFTESFPKKEIYGLTSQFRRSAISIAANIAEGFKKRGKKDKIRYFNIAHGSLEECRYYLILSNDLNYGNHPDLFKLMEEIGKLINAYSRKIQDSEP
ncbi:MAG: four helix bundle protein [Bacteroidetes bacterium]|nr:four helix bundle protein [Bacteroidota bacterium]MBU1421670.1 four helix bundle protein [Bacteroidota bacterium]MBU2636829.1 four helix bundle protein [Bacteroidota bacterium]